MSRFNTRNLDSLGSEIEMVLIITSLLRRPSLFQR